MQINPRGPRSGAALTSPVPVAAMVPRSGRLLAARAGLALAVVGLIGFAVGLAPPALGATAAALLAAFLYAAFGHCPGCETYLLIRRLQPGRMS